MKKIAALLLTLALCAALPVAALAEGEPVIRLATTSVTATEAVVTVSLENNPGIAGLALGFSYDTAKLSLRDIATGGLVGNWQKPANVVWGGDESTYNGVILTLTFDVVSGAVGAAEVTVTYDEGDICNYDLEDVNFTVAPTQVQIPCAEHAWDEGVTTQEASCAQAGEITYTCNVCGETKTEPVPQLEHTPELRGALAATCTADGYTGDTVCTECGATITAGQAIPAAGHTWDEGAVSKEATCTEDGERLFTCAACGETRTEPIPAGHAWDAGVVTKEATASAEGERLYTCAVCGATMTEAIPALGGGTGDAGGNGSTGGSSGNGTGAPVTSPKTGDESNPALYALALTLCLAGVCCLAAVRKKEN